MNMDEARLQLNECIAKLHGDVGYAPGDDWLDQQLDLREQPDGEWLAVPVPGLPSEGIRIRPSGSSVPFNGALGKAVPRLGLPEEPPRFLGSTKEGRYQVYQRGIAVWDCLRDAGQDIGFVIAEWPSLEQRARKCRGMVAFFDLRDFTRWSNRPEVSAGQVQEVIENVELSFQESFSPRWCQKLFAKGIGDGIMVVSEEEWYEAPSSDAGAGFRLGHADAFFRACVSTVRCARAGLPGALKIGCGIDSGEFTQLFLLGRVDYLGAAANRASKVQAQACNDLCLTSDFVNCLSEDGVRIAGTSALAKGDVECRRVSVEEALQALREASSGRG